MEKECIWFNSTYMRLDRVSLSIGQSKISVHNFSLLNLNVYCQSPVDLQGSLELELKNVTVSASGAANLSISSANFSVAKGSIVSPSNTSVKFDGGGVFRDFFFNLADGSLIFKSDHSLFFEDVLFDIVGLMSFDVVSAIFNNNSMSAKRLIFNSDKSEDSSVLLWNCSVMVDFDISIELVEKVDFEDSMVNVLELKLQDIGEVQIFETPLTTLETLEIDSSILNFDDLYFQDMHSLRLRTKTLVGGTFIVEKAVREKEKVPTAWPLV
eukprot:TRINITY_DN5776_c0_g1_i2.p1 TRINITY_DN5776_c0_g1~~TRINITY_DN5776_c0_g1_i2.p1  ORF type:complete len:268 (+),score=30.00 TRINITY_DN5776_c0_g1_i2:102-905(+)